MKTNSCTETTCMQEENVCYTILGAVIIQSKGLQTQKHRIFPGTDSAREMSRRPKDSHDPKPLKPKQKTLESEKLLTKTTSQISFWSTLPLKTQHKSYRQGIHVQAREPSKPELDRAIFKIEVKESNLRLKQVITKQKSNNSLKIKTNKLQNSYLKPKTQKLLAPKPEVRFAKISRTQAPEVRFLSRQANGRADPPPANSGSLRWQFQKIKQKPYRSENPYTDNPKREGSSRTPCSRIDLQIKHVFRTLAGIRSGRHEGSRFDLKQILQKRVKARTLCTPEKEIKIKAGETLSSSGPRD